MEHLDAPTFDHLLSFLTPKDACKLAVQSKGLYEAVGDSLHWKTWCEEDSPSLKTSPARELAAAHYGAAACARATYKQPFLKLSKRRSGLKNTKARSCSCNDETPLELSAYVMLMDVYVGGRGLLFCSTECTVSDFGRQREGWMSPWQLTVRNVCKEDKNGTLATEAERELSSALQQIPSGNPDGVPEGPHWLPSQNLPLYEQGNVLFSWKLMRKTDGKIQILLDRKPVRSRKDFGFRRTNAHEPMACESSFETANVLRDGSGTEWTTFQALMRLCCRQTVTDERALELRPGRNLRVADDPHALTGFYVVLGIARKLEALDAPLLDHLLSFLTPNEACKLAVCSKTLKGLIDTSLLWKTWCERECPSLTTSPARELVRAHYGAEGDVRHKQLYAKLGKQRCDKIVSNASECISKSKKKEVELSDYVMLMDVHVGGEGLLFCSAEGSEMDPNFQGRQEDWEFENHGDRNCMAVVTGMLEPGAQERIVSAFQEVGRNHHDKGYRSEAPARLSLLEQDVILFSWRLMRKADGAMQVLLDQEPVTVKDQGAQPYHMCMEEVHKPGVPYHLRLEAKRAVSDGEGVEWDHFQTLMRMRCYFKNPHGDGSVGFTTRMAALRAWDPPAAESRGFSVEVGIVTYCGGHPDDEYLIWQYVEDFDFRFLLKNVLRRWF
ncbi:hypothetical protein KFL_000050280 [Klebsormidium nitens]|uniref:F-box domain-containing protein n=1 Tax=Klebsormidium nitens TaxID=105231 RepID=A0A1Y1HLN8_KLENI|nr:hypothetical protein KFL_000050280 [Klebsormidium nitens]|eukprot:GAQ77891.1 hypothetical protein KFL_000050280 [Klebsormidium nitens]